MSPKWPIQTKALRQEAGFGENLTMKEKPCHFISKSMRNVSRPMFQHLHASFAITFLDHIFVLYPVFLKSTLIAVSLLFFCVLKRNVFYVVRFIYTFITVYEIKIFSTFDCLVFLWTARAGGAEERPRTLCQTPGLKDYFLLHVNNKCTKQKHILSFIPPDFSS